MNRKNQEKEALERDREEVAPQTIFPKFVPNWTQPIRFDRIVINVSGNSETTQTANTKLYPKLPNSSNGKSSQTKIILNGIYGGLTGQLPLKFS